MPSYQRKAKRECASTRAHFRPCVVEDPGMCAKTKLLARKPGGLNPRVKPGGDGPHREGDEPKPMMHEHEESDPAIVAEKPTNEAGQAGRPAEEPVEPRAGAKENADEGGTLRTPGR